VDWYLAVLKMLNVPVHENFTWLPERPGVAAEVKRKWQTQSARWLVIQPGARWLNKRWPAEYFAELVRELTKSHPDFRFAVLGGDADREMGATIAQAAPQRCLDLTGKISLPEMVEWIRLSELMISNDTGPMHVAAALRKPVVTIFGPTEPRRTGPYGESANTIQLNLPCVPCMKAYCAYSKPLECLRGISPRLVRDRVEAQLRA
jgi:heptosyltransferase-1